jgi:CDP-glycerol glycerophosphotransferase (TagB/SpsB family)
VHILHAPNDATLYRLFGLDYFDVVLLTGEFQADGIRELETKRNLPSKALITVGCTYLDVLRSRIDQMPPAPQSAAKTVLVSPSWGESGLLKRYGMDILGPLARSGFRVIVRPHPQSYSSEAAVLESLQKQLSEFPMVEWDRERENLGSLRRADVMISDFSGIIFDYVFLFSRPVLYTKADFDRRPYDASDVDAPLWTFETLEKIGRELNPSDFPKIGEVIATVVEDSGTRNAIEAARNAAWAFPGEAGSRTVDVLESLIDDLRSKAQR